MLAFLLKTDLFRGGSRIVWSALEPKLLWHNNQEFTLLKIEVPLYSKRLSWCRWKIIGAFDNHFLLIISLGSEKDEPEVTEKPVNDSDE